MAATLLVATCASVGCRAQTEARVTASMEALGQMEVDADISAALARVERLEASVARIEELNAELNIGGEGDSVISWILAVGIILISVPSGGLFYQLVLRPRRLRRDPMPRLNFDNLYQRVGRLEDKEEQRK